MQNKCSITSKIFKCFYVDPILVKVISEVILIMKSKNNSLESGNKSSRGGYFSFSNKKLLVISGIGWLFDAMDVGLLSFIMVDLSNNWHLTLEQTKLIPSINSIGMAIGAFVFGLLSDKIERKNVFIITLLMFSIGSGLTAFSPNLTIFMILRLIIGMGLGGELPVASTLVSESTEVEHRGRVVVLLESFWAIGWILSAIIAFYIIPDYGWRIAMLLTAIPAFYALYLRTNIKDSLDVFPSKKVLSFTNKMKLIWSKEYAKNTVMLWILWFTVVFSYYGMFLWLPTVMKSHGFTMVNSFKYVLIMSLAQLPGYFSAAWLIEKIGRKFVLIFFLLGTAISAAFFGFSNHISTLLVSGAFLSFFNLGAWGGLYAYTPEQYPTKVRGTGVGMAAAFGRLGGIFGPLLIPILVEKHFSFESIFVIFTVAIVIGMLAVLFLGEETKNVVID